MKKVEKIAVIESDNVVRRWWRPNLELKESEYWTYISTLKVKILSFVSVKSVLVHRNHPGSINMFSELTLHFLLGHVFASLFIRGCSVIGGGLRCCCKCRLVGLGPMHF